MIKDKNETLSKATKRLCQEEPFYGIFMMMLNKSWDTGCMTAGVGKNGINYEMVINPLFWDSLTDLWQKMLVKHELLHMCFFHVERGDDFEDHDIRNIAADIVVNQYINPAWLPLFDVSFRQFRDENILKVKSLYDQLKAEQMTKEQVVEELRRIPPRGVYFIDFPELKMEPMQGLDYYYEKLMRAKDKKPGEDGFSQALSDLVGDSNAGFEMVFDHDSWDKFQGMSEAEKKLFRTQMDHQLREVAEQITKSRGTVPGELSGYLDGLDKTEPPKFDWKRYLRRFAGGSDSVYTKKLRRKYNKRYEDNPGLKIKPRRHIFLAVDTSGSVSDAELKEFFHEIYHIQKMGSEITVGQCDAGLSTPVKYRKGLEDSIAISGRGGTSFDPPVDYFNEHKHKFSCMIYFTDGEAPPPVNQVQGKILWVHSSKSSINESLPGLKIKLN